VVGKHLRLCHEPAFGRPSALKEPHVTADGRRVAVTAEVLDELAGGAAHRVSPEGLNCWEAGWCGPGGIVTITSEGPGEDDWY
jgi:hypothetical protein